MNRRQFLRATGVAAVGTTLAGCSGASGTETGTLATRVRDQPGDIDDFETLVLRLTELRVAASNGGTEDGTETDGEDGERTIDIEDTEVDLTELTDGNTELIDESELETGTYAYLKLIVGEVVDARLTDGGEAEVTTPGEAPLKFNAEFEIRADERTTFVADFTPVKRGQTDRYVLQPVADRVEVRYESEGTETTAGGGG